MDVIITPKMLNGTINAVSSKIYLQRALAVSLLANGTTNLTYNGEFNDLKPFFDFAEELGVNVEKNANGVAITGLNRGESAESCCDCKKSGTVSLLQKEKKPTVRCEENKKTHTVRTIYVKDNYELLAFLLSISTIIDKKVKFVVQQERLLYRAQDLISLLNNNNANITVTNNEIVVDGKLSGGKFFVGGKDAESNLSALLIVLPLLNEDSSIVVENVELTNSLKVKVTKQILKEFKIDINLTEKEYQINGNQQCIATDYTVEGDYTNSSAFIVSSAIGNICRVVGLNRQSLQGESQIYSLMSKIVANGSTLNVENCLGLLPSMAVLASFATGKTVFTGVSKYKEKELCNLTDICEQINALGGKVSIENGDLVVIGTFGLKGGKVLSCQNPQLSMAMAIAGTVSENPITICNVEVVNLVYPNFFNELIKIGGNVSFI